MLYSKWFPILVVIKILPSLAFLWLCRQEVKKQVSETKYKKTKHLYNECLLHSSTFLFQTRNTIVWLSSLFPEILRSNVFCTKSLSCFFPSAFRDIAQSPNYLTSYPIELIIGHLLFHSGSFLVHYFDSITPISITKYTRLGSFWQRNTISKILENRTSAKF